MSDFWVQFRISNELLNDLLDSGTKKAYLGIISFGQRKQKILNNKFDFDLQK